MAKHWYQQSAQEVMAALRTSQQGLSTDQANQRIAQYGINQIEFKQTPAWLRFIRQFNDPMVFILLATAIVTGVLTALGEHMLPDTIVIISVVLLNAILGFVQEGKAEGALDALRNMMVPECLVERDGRQHRVPSKDLVPGDIVVLESGDKIPADIRFFEANKLHIDESSLTGESIPIEKHTDPLSAAELVPGDQTNIGFSGTYLTQGTARGIVVATAMNTAFGQIASMVKSAGVTLTPLQKKMKEFVHTLIVAILIIGSLNFAYGVYLGYETSYSFLGAISLVVAAIPEMLPALVTSILALSGTIMAGRKALVRHLPAAETLGATSVICSDKTGTLTENKMTVTKAYAGTQKFQVTGTGYSVEGQFLLNKEPVEVITGTPLHQLLAIGFHCNNAHISSDSSTGDPTEVALKISGAKANLVTDQYHRLHEIPFDSTTKYMASLIEHNGEKYIFVKGAPEVILGMCDHELSADGTTIELDLDKVLATAKSFASDALRTLAFAFKAVTKEHKDLTLSDLSGMTLAGLQGLIDPAKASAIEAVKLCSKAGIRTIMITGDHPDTAQAVAAKLGIKADKAITGAELSNLSEAELKVLVEQVSVFARVAPEHKRSIAKALQENGHVVAMTGDGINDAPALKQADIGIAMGVCGTEVAKESSDMVLADDNFSTIVAAVEEGRHAWNNMQKAILYTLPTNAAQALLIMGAILMAAFVPLFSVRFVLEPIHILWINLLDSVLLTMPLMMEKKEQGLLAVPPRSAAIKIINPLFLQRVIIIGLMISIPGFLVFHHFGAAAVVDGEVVDAMLLTQAQTAAFWSIHLAHVGYVISARSINKSFFQLNPFGNLWLLAGITISILVWCIPLVFPSATSMFRTAAFPTEWWPVVVACMLPSFLAIEFDKLLRNRYGNNATVT